MMHKKMISFPAISKEQVREFGMLLVLVASFIDFYYGRHHLILAVFILALLTLVCPIVFYPFALIWFGFSKIMGRISTGILLALVFIIIVIPVGLIRRMMKLDGLKIKQFKKSGDSVFINREHIYMDSDLLHTF